MISVIEMATFGDDRSSGYQARLPEISPRIHSAAESKVKQAKQIILYALAFLCFSQKLCGKIFDLFGVCAFPCFLDVGVIESFISFPRTFTPTASHADRKS